MPLAVRIVLGSLLVLAGIALLVVAFLGSRSRLRRNLWVGVRTAATLRSDAAFVLANRVGAAPTGAAGAVAVTGGVTVAAASSTAVGLVVLAVTVTGALVLTAAGGVLGDRAARGLAAREPAPSACTGSCAGCDLVAGCRPGTAAEQAARPGPATAPG